MERRIARVSLLALVFSALPWLGFLLAAAVAGLLPPDHRALGVSVGVVSWLGSTLLATFAVVTSGFALLLGQARRRERRGRLVAGVALGAAVLAVGVGLAPPVLAVLGLGAAIGFAALFLAMLPAMGPMGRPLGPVAAGGHLLFASSERIWAARAEDEARSVHAFEALLPVLAAHGAPADLVERVQEAAADEARHAEQAALLAGIETPRPAPEPVFEAPHSLDARLALAEESFVDGCIGEAFAAAVLAEEGRRTGEPAPGAIAADEAEHAELAWDLLTWAVSEPAVAARFTRPAAPRAMVTPSRVVPLWTQLRLYRSVRREALARFASAQPLRTR
jgi:hypothetical protein